MSAIQTALKSHLDSDSNLSAIEEFWLDQAPAKATYPRGVITQIGPSQTTQTLGNDYTEQRRFRVDIYTTDPDQIDELGKALENRLDRCSLDITGERFIVTKKIGVWSGEDRRPANTGEVKQRFSYEFYLYTDRTYGSAA